eukprot:SAG31_NODE_25699_length_456_cov_0.865546_1_plen_120_part_10
MGGTGKTRAPDQAASQTVNGTAAPLSMAHRAERAAADATSLLPRAGQGRVACGCTARHGAAHVHVGHCVDWKQGRQKYIGSMGKKSVPQIENRGTRSVGMIGKSVSSFTGGGADHPGRER